MFSSASVSSSIKFAVGEVEEELFCVITFARVTPLLTCSSWLHARRVKSGFVELRVT